MENLFELSCPNCKSGEELDIEARLWVRLTPDGTDADSAFDGSHAWDASSRYHCNGCLAKGHVADLLTDGDPVPDKAADRAAPQEDRPRPADPALAVKALEQARHVIEGATDIMLLGDGEIITSLAPSTIERIALSLASVLVQIEEALPAGDDQGDDTPDDIRVYDAEIIEEVARLGRSHAAIEIAQCADGLFRFALELCYSYGGFAGPITDHGTGYVTAALAKHEGIATLLGRIPKGGPSDPDSVRAELAELKRQLAQKLTEPSLF